MASDRTRKRRQQRIAARTRPPRPILSPAEKAMFNAVFALFEDKMVCDPRMYGSFEVEGAKIGTVLNVRLPARYANKEPTS